MTAREQANIYKSITGKQFHSLDTQWADDRNSSYVPEDELR